MFGNAQRKHGNQDQVLTELRRALAQKTQGMAAEQPRPLPTELPLIDAALQGGLPRGKLIELVGGAGKMAFTLLALAAATQRGELCALVDCDDSLDVRTAARVGVVLERLLWVRLPSPDDAPAAPGPALAQNDGRQRSEKAAVQHSAQKAVDLLLGAGGFGLVVLYAAGRAGRLAGFSGGTAWPRLVQRSEQSRTALLVVAEQPWAGSFAAATLRCAPGETVWEKAPGGRLVLRGHSAAIEVERSRLGPPGEAAELSLRK
jgi:hypothetical protein